MDKFHTAERVKWKNEALKELRLIEINKAIQPIEYTHEGWFSPQGLRMKDGSSIIFRSRCHKEDPEIQDIFVSRASNDKWYYSTYHFCIDALTIMDEQPASLEAFITHCYLVEFDGSSDDCLLPTWTP